jgi:hypothetical protein
MLTGMILELFYYESVGKEMTYLQKLRFYKTCQRTTRIEQGNPGCSPLKSPGIRKNATDFTNQHG